jgi:hypothetical protein
MIIDRRLLAGALGLSLALAACGGSSTASPAATAGDGAATAAPTTEPAATPAETEAATEAVETEEPVATEDATDDSTGEGGLGPLTALAALLPTQAGDVTFQRGGFDGDQFGMYGAMAGLNEDQLTPILEKYGKTLNDVNFAIAAPDSTSGATAMIFAIQIEGVDAEESMSAMGMDGSQMEKTTVGGKQVYAQGGGGFGVWAYPKDDVLFLVLLASEDVAESALEQLP